MLLTEADQVTTALWYRTGCSKGWYLRVIYESLMASGVHSTLGGHRANGAGWGWGGGHLELE